ncbi:YqaJ-like viral recombinase [Achromobacter marplatensis]|uniref:YqaJ-like recombinase protein n=1 Tax=Achromobacter marplatensis TaxID=470868 RepID=A0ABX9FWY3_9BURK|nr:lambda exonuclease family protein [Achromobacter marplatensis]OWT54001.1 YqaJ-like viral recombinase [Achromobacter marplatensis]RBP09776.1 YqaJ-like recombinase protein [Achromobacter marplatensis]CAB3717156.1 hypothetical protein LMG26219_06308 [Achromobacter marplatensis]
MQFHDVQQNTDEWQALRLGKATASNFGCIMANYGKAFGDPAKRYALQLALELATGKKAEYSFNNEHMERGHEQEPVARMLYEEEYFVDVSNGGFFCHDTYGDSPDGLVNDDGGVEIKSVIASTHYATLTRGDFDPAYRWQLIGHLDCTGRDWFDFVSYCSDFPEDKRLLVYRLWAKDYQEEIERLRIRRAEFIELVQQTFQKIRS